MTHTKLVQETVHYTCPDCGGAVVDACGRCDGVGYVAETRLRSVDADLKAKGRPARRR